jgi:hypothetical protein
VNLLYHISDRPDIARFDPRPAPYQASGLQPEGEMVWAVDGDHLQNYLLPRDCPRVTFYALPTSTPEDVERLMAGTAARYVIAIETGWLPEVLRTTLYRYDFAPDPFVLQNADAGYYISREPIVPIAVTPIPDLLTALLEYDVELRIMPSLWGLRDRVVAATLQFSIIRWRNARPRD